MSYLEQSTRYLGYDRRFATATTASIAITIYSSRSSGPVTSARWTACSTPTPNCCRFLLNGSPRNSRRRRGHRLRVSPGVRAKALDATRASCRRAPFPTSYLRLGQAYESLLLHMRAHPLLEVRLYGQLMMDELVKVIPSFLKRVDVPERGVAWSTYMSETKSATRDLVASM